MEILKLYIHVTGMNKLETDDSTVQMILFDGTCRGEWFNGTIMSGGVDTQIYGPNGGTLSARYMLEGIDCEDVPCHMFIENNGAVAINGETKTVPKIYTDSKALRWLEQESLSGRITDENGQLVILIENEPKGDVK